MSRRKRYGKNDARAEAGRVKGGALGNIASALRRYRVGQPPRCDDEVFRLGEPIAALDARMWDAEEWVRSIAKHAKARLDWHYSGGTAQVLHLGDAESRARVEAEIEKREHYLKGRIIGRYAPGESGLYRADVTEVPEGTIAVDPVLGPIVSGADRLAAQIADSHAAEARIAERVEESARDYVAGQASEIGEILSTPVETIPNLPPSAARVLREHKPPIITYGELISYTRKYLLSINGIGPKAVERMAGALAENKLAFKGEED